MRTRLIVLVVALLAVPCGQVWGQIPHDACADSANIHRIGFNALASLGDLEKIDPDLLQSMGIDSIVTDVFKGPRTERTHWPAEVELVSLPGSDIGIRAHATVNIPEGIGEQYILEVHLGFHNWNNSALCGFDIAYIYTPAVGVVGLNYMPYGTWSVPRNITRHEILGETEEGIIYNAHLPFREYETDRAVIRNARSISLINRAESFLVLRALWIYSTEPIGTPLSNEDGPVSFSLSPAYPNPFNPTTNFTLALDRAQVVQVTVYDALGRRVTTLASGEMPAGTHRLTFDAVGLPSGLYVIRGAGAGFSETRRVVLQK